MCIVQTAVKRLLHAFADLRGSSLAHGMVGARLTWTSVRSRWYNSIPWTDACVGVSSHGNPGMQGTACECVLITLLSLHPVAVSRIFYGQPPQVSLSLYLPPPFYSYPASVPESHLRLLSAAASPSIF